ncbi:MAG: 30S ribosomal protein S20 [Candidatus Kerfeldbacteria bacterium]|nr:30S ribosomal protein S20 [Candidatus Kerfeldbacteria bacterium]
MPNKENAKKALRQSRKRALTNRMKKDAVKRLVKDARADVTSQKDTARASVLAAIKALDRAVQRKLIKKNTAARKKSRLMKRLNALAAK